MILKTEKQEHKKSHDRQIRGDRIADQTESRAKRKGSGYEGVRKKSWPARKLAKENPPSGGEKSFEQRRDLKDLFIQLFLNVYKGQSSEQPKL